MNDDELAGLLTREIAQADGWDSGELQAHREEALAYYYNDPRGDEKAGESKVQSSDLADMVNAVLAQLTPMISTDALVEFEATAETDEDAARMETDVVNDMVMDKNPGYVNLQECLKDACLCRNAFAKVWPEELEETEVREFSRPKADLGRVVSVMNERPGVEAELQDYDDEAGRGKIKVKTTTRRYRWKAVDPLNVLFQSGATTQDLQELRFFAEVDFPTRSDLISEGYSPEVVNDLPQFTLDTRSGQTKRNRDGTNAIDEAQTKDQERVERHECYIMLDDDDDGISERWQVIVAGGSQTGGAVVLHKEQVQWTPYASGTLFIAPHRLSGEDLHDRLKQTQDTKTAALRRWLDNLYSSTWPRTFVGPGVDPDAVEEGRSGAVIQTKGPPAESVFTTPVVPVGDAALQLLNYEDQRRTERAGAALDMQAADAQLVGETMGGIMKQYSVKEALAAMMAKNIAETLIRNVYLLFHRTLRTFSDRPLPVRLRDQWQEADPGQWPARSSVNVMPGLTPGQRTATEQCMAMTLQWQAAAMQNGLEGQLVSLDGMYRAFLDYVRAKGVDNPQQYAIDPSSDEAKAAGQHRQQAQQEQAQMQQQVLGQQLQIENQKLQLQKYEADLKAATDRYKANLDAELKEAELIEEGVANARDATERARQETARGSQAGSNGTTS